MNLLKPIFIFILSCIASSLRGQQDSTRRKFIQQLTSDLSRRYVSADLAKKMCDTINTKFAAGLYDSSLNPDEFAWEITSDLRKVSHDLHLTVAVLHSDSTKYFDRPLYSYREAKKYFAQAIKRRKEDKFDYGEIKILPGNVGYLEIKEFTSASMEKAENVGRITIKSVMHFLKNTDALIIDLRQCKGGILGHAILFCSYFAKEPETYFVTTKHSLRRDPSGIVTDASRDYDSYTFKRINDHLTRTKKVYVLTSHRTFSAGEFTAYKIKRFKPGTTIVGEKTAGGGNGYTGVFESKYYAAIIPTETSFDKSNANFSIEGHGVSPDIAVSSDSAFDVAYRSALHEDAGTVKTATRYLKGPLSGMDTLASAFEPYYPDYTGDYRKVRVQLLYGRLFLHFDNIQVLPLTPDQKDIFLTKYFRTVKFVRDNNNKVTEIQLQYKDGYVEKLRRRE